MLHPRSRRQGGLFFARYPTQANEVSNHANRNYPTQTNRRHVRRFPIYRLELEQPQTQTIPPRFSEAHQGIGQRYGLAAI